MFDKYKTIYEYTAIIVKNDFWYPLGGKLKENGEFKGVIGDDGLKITNEIYAEFKDFVTKEYFNDCLKYYHSELSFGSYLVWLFYSFLEEHYKVYEHDQLIKHLTYSILLYHSALYCSSKNDITRMMNRRDSPYHGSQSWNWTIEAEKKKIDALMEEYHRSTEN